MLEKLIVKNIDNILKEAEEEQQKSSACKTKLKEMKAEEAKNNNKNYRLFTIISKKDFASEG